MEILHRAVDEDVGSHLEEDDDDGKEQVEVHVLDTDVVELWHARLVPGDVGMYVCMHVQKRRLVVSM